MKKKPVIYQFAIQKNTLKCGKEVFIPVVRVKPKGLIGWLIGSIWERISLVEGQYILMELPFYPELTKEDCMQRISRYQDHLEALVADNIIEETYLSSHEKEF